MQLLFRNSELKFHSIFARTVTGLYPEPDKTVRIFRAYVSKTILCIVPESLKLPHKLKSAHTNFVSISDPFYVWCVLHLACPSWIYYSKDA
jgi:hypothetical protein